MEFESYGIKFIFNKYKNKKINNFDWFVDVLEKQEWEPKTFEIFNKFKDKNKIAIDIGGWIGPTTIYLSKFFKEVITIEPDGVAFESLTENIKDNSCNNVILHNKAFYNSSTKNILFGVNSFNFDPVFGSSTSQTKIKKDNETDFLIETINIFDIIKYVDPNSIGIIKVDIEGGDEDIFEELILVGSKYSWKIWIAFHYEWWKDKDVNRFEYLVGLMKKVYSGTVEIPKNELLKLISLNATESFLIEL